VTHLTKVKSLPTGHSLFVTKHSLITITPTKHNLITITPTSYFLDSTN